MFSRTNVKAISRYSSYLRTKCAIKNQKKKRHSSKQAYLPQPDRNWEWFEPPQESASVHFFRNTSLHGLRYVGEIKRHLCERIFWLTAFTAATTTATILIWQMWEAHMNMPIVTVFNPTEKTLDQIPFPAITICSVNNVKQSKWTELHRDAELGLRGELANETLWRTLANLRDIYHICYSARSFTQRCFDHQISINEELLKGLRRHYSAVRQFFDITGTLRKTSQSCAEMVVFCMWLNGIKNCSDLFQEIQTDFGYCCTFNMIPLTLLRTYVKNPTDDPNRVKDWKDADINYENLFNDKSQQSRKYPYRQRYAGRSAGLSILVDPDLEEYHCTNTDSEGFLVGINVPLDFPRMKDNGIAIRTNTETFLNIHPEITLSAPSARGAKLEKRHCYFEGEKKLDHYTKYTQSNCLDECVARKTLLECNCTRYYMPRHNNANESLCRPAQYNCTESVEEKIMQGGLDQECDNCWATCTEIKYHTEITSLRIREQQIRELMKHHPKLSWSDDRVKNASIIHIYFSEDSVFPRLRKEMSTLIDLISNAGGLLGLCMGFSMLSLLEILYHATIRVLCNAYRERCDEVGGNKSFNLEHKMLFSLHHDNHGFLSKIFPRNTMLENNAKNEDESLFKMRGVSEHSGPLPAHFRTPFETDFQRTYVATTWMSSQPNFVGNF